MATCGSAATRSSTQSRSSDQRPHLAAAARPGRHFPCGAIALPPLHHRRRLEPECRGHLATALTRPHRSNHALTQIKRISSCHACWPPPPACSVNYIRDPLGIPRDSIRDERALRRRSRPTLPWWRTSGSCQDLAFGSIICQRVSSAGLPQWPREFVQTVDEELGDGAQGRSSSVTTQVGICHLGSLMGRTRMEPPCGP